MDVGLFSHGDWMSITFPTCFVLPLGCLLICIPSLFPSMFCPHFLFLLCSSPCPPLALTIKCLQTCDTDNCVIYSACLNCVYRITADNALASQVHTYILYYLLCLFSLYVRFKSPVPSSLLPLIRPICLFYLLPPLLLSMNSRLISVLQSVPWE